MENLTIRRETPADYRAVEALTREAFWNVYQPGADEHYFAHMLRKHPDFVPELDFVLEREGEIIGSILYSRTRLIGEDGTVKPILSFGPICIAPQDQRRGYSRRLIEHSFACAREMGYDAVVIYGNPANYVGRGFVSCKKMNVCLAGDIFPTSLLVRELIQGALGGKRWQFIDCDAAECCADVDAVAAFDAAFPEKEKAWRPSQEEFYIYSRSSVVR